MIASKSFKKVSASLLFVTEPNPSHFGNPKNESNSSSWTNNNWLKSRFHFSFAEYSNSKNQRFGVLRVMNDDLVQPDRGFGTHPHSNMEIVTYVVNGELTHKDSMGTCETLGRSAIQFMTAGTGVTHSEFNLSKTNPLRFIQMWIDPRQRGLKPNYGSMLGDEAAIRNTLRHIVSDVSHPEVQTPVKVNQDINIYACVLDKDQSVQYKVEDNRQVYFLCIEGDLKINYDEETTQLNQHDAAEIKGPLQLQIEPESLQSHFLFVEMAKTNDSRF